VTGRAAEVANRLSVLFAGLSCLRVRCSEHRLGHDSMRGMSADWAQRQFTGRPARASQSCCWTYVRSGHGVSDLPRQRSVPGRKVVPRGYTTFIGAGLLEHMATAGAAT
jgi:hypothetical protein